MAALRDAGLGEHAHVGVLNARDEDPRHAQQPHVFQAKRDHLQRTWSETSWRMQALRDNLERRARGVRPHHRPGRSRAFGLSHLPQHTFGCDRRRPRIAILREQGVNGQVEMAAAFDRAGFESVDVHMTDLIAGRASLEGFKGFAAGGGFSYGDVLGGGQGWGRPSSSTLARAEFERFFARTDTFALGACNGCQMMGALRELVPGAGGWPLFVRNRSEQFEARLVMVEIVESRRSSSPAWRAAACRSPPRTAKASRTAPTPRSSACATSTTAASRRRVPVQPERRAGRNHRPHHARRALHHRHAASGARVPQRADVLAPPGAPEDSPWMQLYNARRWVG